MSKYAPLTAHLSASGQTEIPMMFGHIETIIGGKLPASALRHRSWWSNNPSNSVITSAWIEAGYLSADVDMARRTLVFRKSTADRALEAPGGDERDEPDEGWFSRVFGALRGTVTVHPGTDLTAPVDEEWDAAG